MTEGRLDEKPERWRTTCGVKEDMLQEGEEDRRAQYKRFDTKEENMERMNTEEAWKSIQIEVRQNRGRIYARTNWQRVNKE